MIVRILQNTVYIVFKPYEYWEEVVIVYITLQALIAECIVLSAFFFTLINLDLFYQDKYLKGNRSSIKYCLPAETKLICICNLLLEIHRIPIFYAYIF